MSRRGDPRPARVRHTRSDRLISTTLTSVARVALVAIVGLGAVSTACAQDVRLRIEGGDWRYHVGPDAQACASPCETQVPPGVIDLGIAAPADRDVHHRVRFTLREPAELRVGRRSREAERIAGIVTIVTGALGGIVAFGGIAASYGDDPYAGAAIGLVALPSAASIVLALSLLGALISGLDDQPVVQLRSGSSGARALAPDSAESRVFADIDRAGSRRWHRRRRHGHLADLGHVGRRRVRHDARDRDRRDSRRPHARR
jgi:hypothetical protein